ncbi:MAG TPA: peptidase, partial [Candidatus Angelobacter sp.]|nr:peptidase [Candidatus Angelobacter sp.]
MKRALAAVAALFIFTSLLVAQNPARKDQSRPIPTIAEKTAGMQSNPGFFADYWDAREGTLWLRIENAKLETPFILYESLPSGVGSNDIGLDRGEPGESYVVHFERSGKQVLLVAE